MNKQSNNNPITGLDGYPRTKNLEEEISLNFTHLFSTPTGKACLQYIVGLMERRMQHGHKINKES